MDVMRKAVAVLEPHVSIQPNGPPAPRRLRSLDSAEVAERSHTAPDPAPPCRMWAARAPSRTDPSKLQIILRNLIHNALRFTHHGTITVSVTTRPDRQQLTFVVQDSGDRYQSRAPDRDLRDVPSGARGAGQHGRSRPRPLHRQTAGRGAGAEIEVSSAPGRSATFRIHVPVAGPLAPRA
jgi:signal transduction histidine kinase